MATGLLEPAEARGLDGDVGARLGHLALLEQQRSEGVAHRLHPSPRLVVREAVVELDGPLGG